MKKIWKYDIDVECPHIPVPEGGIIRHIDTQLDEQFEDICLWIEVDPKAMREMRHFGVFVTGEEVKPKFFEHSIEVKSMEYIGTVKLENGARILHVYELIPPEQSGKG